MNQIPCCDWLPARARWSDLTRSGLRDLSREKKFTFWCLIPYNKSFIDQACSVKMALYWPRSFLASLCTSTSSQSINTQKKKNLANTQPSCPLASSIAHTYKVLIQVNTQIKPVSALPIFVHPSASWLVCSFCFELFYSFKQLL